MHKTCNLKDGYMGSGLLLRRSIKKHGLNNHFIEILEYCDSYEKLAEREQYIVNSDLLNDPLCMNLKTGGIGGATMTGRKQSKETIEKNNILLVYGNKDNFNLAQRFIVRLVVETGHALSP